MSLTILPLLVYPNRGIPKNKLLLGMVYYWVYDIIVTCCQSIYLFNLIYTYIVIDYTYYIYIYLHIHTHTRISHHYSNWLFPGGSHRRREDLAAGDAHHSAQQRPGAGAGPAGAAPGSLRKASWKPLREPLQLWPFTNCEWWNNWLILNGII